MTTTLRQAMAVNVDLRALARSRNGKLLITAAILGGGVGLTGLFRQIQADQRRARRRKQERSGAPQPGQSRKKNTAAAAVNKLLAFLLPLVGRRIAVLFVLAALRTAISNRLARVQGYMFRAAFMKRVPLFMQDFLENVVLCVVAAGVETSSKRFTDRIAVSWRQILTSSIHQKYFQNMTYYKLSYVDGRIPHPEHRLCEDIPRFCDGLADLLREWINSAVDAAVFAFLLRQYSRTHKYTAGIMGYVLGAGVMTTIFAPNFGRLYSRQQENEGEYRNLQQRLTNNAESIAFYGGINREGMLIRARFKQLVKHQLHLLRTQWRFSMWQDFHTKYLAATVAVVLIIGPFFTGHLRPDDSMRGRASMLSNMRYHTSVIIALFSALGTLASSSRKLMKLGAYADRITGLQDVARHVSHGKLANKVPAAGGSVQASPDEIAFEHARVITPSGAALVQDLSLRVPSGTNLLVTGPNGSGKSSLFRVLGGLWPLTEGVVRKPGGAEGGLAHDIFYVPQRPYVTIGTLQDQLIYPLTRAEGEGDIIPEDDLRDLLAQVDLEYLADLPGGLSNSLDWGAQLSLGEQQRLGFGRLLYHRPKFAILDECTSGVTVDMEERFCNMVKEMGCTCVTISHRPALVAFHDLVLALDGEGGWSLHRGARASPSGSNDSFEPLPSGGESAEPKEGPGARARTEAATACLTGMQALIGSSQSSSPQPDGSLVVASGPSPDAPAMPCMEPPRKQLQPDKLGTWPRWRMVLHELLGQGRGARQLAGILVVVFMRTALQDRIAALNGRSVQHVLKQDRGAFMRLIGLSAVQSLLSAVLAPSLRYVTDSLALAWRRRLTGAAHRLYLKGNTFYTTAQLAGLQDVDQRLTRDIERLCDDLSALIPSLVKPLVDLAWFSVALGRLTGRRGMGVLYLYAIAGFAVLHSVTPNFGALLHKEYSLEAAFRSVHTRLRTHAESIAFFGGGEHEGTTIAGYFDRLLSHRRRVIDIRWAYSMADDFFTRQLPHNVTWALTLLYALDSKGEFSDTAVQGELVSNMRYLASVVTQCFTAFGELLALHKRFVELSGGVSRVSEMLEVMQKAEHGFAAPAAPPTLPSPADNDSIAFDQVDACTPAGRVLTRQLSVAVRRHHSILVTGPNGCGKSSLFRILGGLWPLAGGAIFRPGHEGIPTAKDIFYVPQKPYTTPGSLREQVIYPLSTGEAAQQEEGKTEADRLQALDLRLDALMGVVRLSYLVSREGGWTATASWGDTLSLGEQQRMGMARLFFRAPAFGVLDECTNAISVDAEEALYAHAASLGITLVTITQRAALLAHHAAELRLSDVNGAWQLRALPS